MAERIGKPTGPSQAEPVVSALRAAVPCAGHILFSTRARVSKAISDPSSVCERLHGDGWVEDGGHWQARAALEIVLREAARSLSFAQAIEARRAATENTDAVHESAVAKPCAQYTAQKETP